jgi:hypothetical protein
VATFVPDRRLQAGAGRRQSPEQGRGGLGPGENDRVGGQAAGEDPGRQDGLQLGLERRRHGHPGQPGEDQGHQGPQGNRLRHIAALGGHTHHIARAVDRRRTDFDRPLRIAAVAREVGVSVSGFHHHFKAVTALSPLQLQKQLRLQEAAG